GEQLGYAAGRWRGLDERGQARGRERSPRAFRGRESRGSRQERFRGCCGRIRCSTRIQAGSMSPSRIFILRPVATTLLMVGILLAGVVAYKQLPVSALPEVDYPTIQIVTFYPGASPEVMASSVTAPLERQFGQVPGLSQMTST